MSVHLSRAEARRLALAAQGLLGPRLHRGRPADRAALDDSAAVPVTVEGWAPPAWADPSLLDALGSRRLAGRCRTALLSPFDWLVWERRRTERLFDFTHRLEAYTPAAQREHGYFTMPLLAGGRLRGRVDPRRAGRTLVARQLSLEPGAEAAMATALVEAAWVGCDGAALERVLPEASAARLRTALDGATDGRGTAA